MLFELALARDIDALQENRSIGDPVRSGLVHGMSLVIQRRWVDAVPALERSFAGLADEPDSRTRYRVGVLLAWTRVMIGAPAGEVADALDQAASESDPDPALRTYHSIAAGQLRLQQAPTGQLVGLLGSDPASQIPVEDTHLLGWRGAVQALSGQLERGERDLREYQRRVQNGVPDATDGADFAVLAYAQWMSGQWMRSRVSLGIAVESRFSRTHPIVAAVRPLGPIGLGASDEAAEMLAQARTALVQAPWPPALQVAFQADVLWHRVFGTEPSRAGLVQDWRRTFGARVQDVGGAVSVVWLLHLAIALTWANEPGAARELAVRVAMAPPTYPWAPGAAEWVSGLADEQDGHHADARAHLRRAAELGLATLPLHQAHLTVDLARVEAVTGDRATGQRLLRLAAGLYATLGAQQQLSDVVTGSAGAWKPGSDPADVADPLLAGLSDREREVVALVAQGLSYGQIATEIYVSRSTVAFHVGRIFAKTNTASRHELVALVRRA
jgi:DNA-binding CsgD family transcriptional regulator